MIDFTGRGKCPNCGIETEVSKYSNIITGSLGEVYGGNCSKCGDFQTAEVWRIVRVDY